MLSHTVMYAQDNPIVPDRPGFSTGTYTVKPGWFNVESGYQYAFNNNGINYTTQTVPLLNLRIGISPKAELNFLWDGWNIQDEDNVDVTQNGTQLTLRVYIEDSIPNNCAVIPQGVPGVEGFDEAYSEITLSTKS